MSTEHINKGPLNGVFAEFPLGGTISVFLEKDDSPGKIDIPGYLQWLFGDEPEI